MRAILGCGLVLALAVSAGARPDEKIDPNKLIGKWTTTGKGATGTTEFTKDGAIITVVEAKGKEFKHKGTYKLDGDKLTITRKNGDKEDVTESIVKKLTDTELVFETPKLKKTDTLKRAK